MAKITGKFNWQTREVPSFFEGEDAEAVYLETNGIRTGNIGYDPQTKLVYGSTPFLASRADTVLRTYGFRVATLKDLSNPLVMQMIKDRHYSDTPALIVRTENDTNSKNNPLIRMLLKESSRLHEKMPFIATGFDSVPFPEYTEGYKIRIVPRSDFRIISDERLSGKFDSRTFSEVDELGLPNFTKGGSRTWYARNKGISRLFLDRDLDLDSGYEDLAYSYDSGRVVVVNSTEGAQKNLDEYVGRLTAALREANEFNQRIVDEAIKKLKR